ncbi:MAG: hypothetical protein V1911_03120 [Candidatus Micrarchaeota archaeon]
MKYAFLFGKNWKLSLAELTAYLDMKGIKFTVLDVTKFCAFVECEISPEKVIDGLGGTLKIVEITNEIPHNGLADYISKLPEGTMVSGCGNHGFFTKIKKCGALINKGGAIGAMELNRRGIGELYFIESRRMAYFGKTVACYDPLEQMKRDDKRPNKDWLTIAPSRARILVNLSRGKQNILDPFCGMGTIGAEAALAGINIIYMSDKSKVAVTKTEQNMRWFRKEYGAENKFFYKVADARMLEKEYNKIEAVATEPDLGAPFKEEPRIRDARRMMRTLNSLYYAFFRSLHRTLTPGARVAIVLPCINTGDGKVFAEKEFPGYRPVDIFEKVPGHIRKQLALKGRTVVDEEREKGRLRITAREFCVFRPV